MSQLGQILFGVYTFGPETFQPKTFWSEKFLPKMFQPKFTSYESDVFFAFLGPTRDNFM